MLRMKPGAGMMMQVTSSVVAQWRRRGNNESSITVSPDLLVLKERTLVGKFTIMCKYGAYLLVMARAHLHLDDVKLHFKG